MYILRYSMGLTMLDKISINLYDILAIRKFWQVMAVKMKPYWPFLLGLSFW